MDGPSDNGTVNYLIYMVMGLGAFIFGLVQKHFGARVTKVEEAATSCSDTVHAVELQIRDRFAKHERDEQIRHDAHRKEVRRDFKDLHNKVEEGHREILKEIRNGNGRA